ncbi:hypothetical protein [Halorhodospira neutriphila]|uniref:hypothetical protein n=1 Tax=Halorhodospira neutriphila TaxID=168379 RepID=UPI001904FFEB|nr:hypothetical protein [Halorhodospira neutriphila]
MTNNEILERLKSKYYLYAKRLWSIGIILQISVAIGSAALTIFGVRDVWASLFLVLVAASGIFASWWASRSLSVADTLQRSFEFGSLLGWETRNTYIRDALASAKLDESNLLDDNGKSYWNSVDSPGPRRVLNGVIESAFFSKHLSNSMTRICYTLATLVLVSAFIALLGVAESGLPMSQKGRIAGEVATVASFVVLGRILQLGWNYAAFSSHCDKIINYAEPLLAKKEPLLSESVLVLSDYQAGRRDAPPLPDRLYKLRRAKLNQLWQMSYY